ncbi:hypothetical protein XA68_17174 [Ophiocordyceps unilateralis]|uniref:DUF676 domain-containing protein n=1 Tax=Ophiocordyceps unilateralis TaxID=268505 RepID=A0A2A9P4D0_OPHUN|nr:hypothetical protein XA68_17174 [Ophiocordyceps unilateralis]
MLLLHQTGGVKVGELVRYTVTYAPLEDDAWPRPSRLYLRIGNTCPVAKRVAVFPGPFTLSVCAFPSVFDPFRKLDQPAEHGVPEFEPQVKAGTHWECELLIPREVLHAHHHDETQTVSWVIEVSSQVVFTKSAVVSYELLIASDPQELRRGLVLLTSPGRLVDHQELMRAVGEPSTLQSPGVFSTAVTVKVEDTMILWRSPAMVPAQPSHKSANRDDLTCSDEADQMTAAPRKPRKIHLVVMTHGLNSTIGSDLLFLKESIDAAARRAKAQALASGDVDEDEYENVIVRGYSGNATKTQRGIKFLGKRVAKYVLSMTYPDQPCLPTGRTSDDGFAQGFAGDLDARHQHAHPYMPHEYRGWQRQSYQVTSISFIGHSLGGPTQTYAIAYIQKRSPTFFDLIKPRSFITLASPMLGVSSENPLYVRLCLEAGFVGRSGRDLGLSWGPKTIARSGWGALVASLAGSSASSSPHASDRPGSKPLMQILPTGPAHVALAKFVDRTVYANVVNDGIVPLRTSSLLFLDWQSLERVERARRDTGLISNVSRHLMIPSQRPATRRGGPGYDMAVVPQPTEEEVVDEENGLTPPAPPTLARTPRSGYSPSRAPLSGVFKLAKRNAPDRFVSQRHKQMLSRGQTFHLDDLPSAERTDLLGREPRRREADIRAPPTTTFLEGFGDVLTPVVASVDFLIDPEARPKTIIHDRVYRPADIPPMQNDNMRVEERVARSYHHDMSWRKVLVKMEPDAHNNIVVRRQFSNAHGWPVIKHLADTHFGRGEEEPISPVKPPLPPRAYSHPTPQPEPMEPHLLAWSEADWQDSEDDSETDESGSKLTRLAARATHYAADGIKT